MSGLRGWSGAALLALVALILAGAWVMRPAVQRELMLTLLAPHVDAIEVGRVRVTPWSLTLEPARLEVAGVEIRLRRIHAVFNPLRLLGDTLAVSHLELEGAEIDLTGFSSPPDSRPFPGLLAFVDRGFALSLGHLALEARVRLPTGQRLELKADATDIRPHLAGRIPLAFSLAENGDAARVEAEGALEIAQLARGRLRTLALDLDGKLRLPSREIPEHFRVRFSARPPRGLAAGEMNRTRLENGKEVRVPAPESWQLEIVLPEASDTPRARFTTDARYTGETGLLTADARLVFNDALLRPWLEQPPPAFATTLTGHLRLDVPTAHADFSFGHDTRVALPSPLPELHLETSVEGYASESTLVLERAALSANLAGSATALLSGTLGKSLAIPLANPAQLLATPRTLASFTLGPIPLQSLSLPAVALEGSLAGALELGIDAKSRLYLRAPEALLWNDARISQGPTVLLDALSLQAAPLARWSPKRLHLALEDVQLQRPTSGSPSQFQLSVSRPLDREDGTWRARMQGEVAMALLNQQPALANVLTPLALPDDLGLRLTTEASYGARGMRVEHFDIALGAGSATPQIALGLSAPFVLMDKAGRWRVPANAQAALPAGLGVTTRIHALPLAWADPWLAQRLAGYTLEGMLEDAAWRISTSDAGILRLEAETPLRVTGAGLRHQGRSRLRGLSLAASPSLQLGAGTFTFTSGQMTLAAGAARLFGGEVAFDLPVAGGTERVQATLRGDFDVGASLRQPLLAQAVPTALRGLSAQASVTLVAAGSPTEVEVQRAEVVLLPDARARLHLLARPGFIVRPQLAAGEPLARHLQGELALTIDDLASGTLARVLPLGETRFNDLSARFKLVSDGQRLTANSLAPLSLDDIRLGPREQPRLAPFGVAGRIDLTLTQRTLKASLDDLSLRFQGGAALPALSGRAALTWVPDATIPLRALDLALEAELPQWLAQPIAIPGHHLQSGKLMLAAKVDPSRKLEGRLALDDLASRKPLPIRSLELPLQGTLAADGRGFDFSAPVIAEGRSGATRATVRGHYAPEPDEPRVITLGLASEILYLNDWLAAMRRIQPDAAPASTTAAGRTPRRPNTTPDAHAAWKVMPPALVIEVAIDSLFYSDYLAFHAVAGTLDLRSRRMLLKDIEAHFHDSRISLNGRTGFTAGAAEPYALELKGEVTDFDLNEFLSELVPGRKPRMEGLFSGRLNAHGQFPNFDELRNRVLFDVKLQSREGLFRPLPPDSGLLLGASAFLGVVGEGLSYLPTGGFGAGAVARLVNYMAEIDYDTIDIHLERRGPEGVRLAAFEMLSPTIAMMAHGDIRQTAGVDLLDSPLELTAELDMLGKGAAILYSLNLLEDVRSATGYWRGPRFKVWGSLTEPHSNLEAIINTAGDAAVQGAWSRPLSGLLGNVKYRWRDDNARTREEAREARAVRARAREATAPEAP